jgi:hypothetical protein
VASDASPFARERPEADRVAEERRMLAPLGRRARGAPRPRGHRAGRRASPDEVDAKRVAALDERAPGWGKPDAASLPAG